MSETAEFRRARFKRLDGGEEFEVHFNPASLQYEISSNVTPEGGDAKSRQFTALSTGKLSMELVFDTTHNGEDVREHTRRVSRLMKPDKKRAPPRVRFIWGVYTFTGVVEGYRETIDFFSPSGVPLRAAVSLTMASQEDVFDPAIHADVDVYGSLRPEPVRVATPAGGAAAVAARAGDPRAARALAALNGLETLRFGTRREITVPSGSGFGLPKGLLGKLREVSAAVSAGRGGARAEAAVRFTGRLDPRALLPLLPTGGLAAGRGALFGVAGRANLQAPASLRADVGATATLRSRIRFNEEGGR